MELQEYSTEELKAELSRRAEEARAEREKVLRCRMCKHYGSINAWGQPNTNKEYWDALCPFQKTSNGKRYRVLNRSQKACEHFEKENKR